MISLDLRDEIIRYIDQDITLEQLEDLIIPRLPDYLEFYYSTDAEIISALELGFAEISNQNWTEARFRNYLKNALLELNVILEFSNNEEIQTSSGANSETIDLQYSNSLVESAITIV